MLRLMAQPAFACCDVCIQDSADAAADACVAWLTAHGAVLIPGGGMQGISSSLCRCFVHITATASISSIVKGRASCHLTALFLSL